MNDLADEPVHPIQAVARRTGLTPDVIRAWERRYGAVTPRRSTTQRRLYSESDVERLLLLRRATLGGRRIGDVAGMPTQQLAPLVEADEIAAARAPRAAQPQAAGPSPTSYREAILEAVGALDGEGLDAVLRRAARELGTDVLLGDVLTPAVRSIGERWAAGSLRICAEHMATTMIRSLLETLRAAHSRSFAGPEIVIATPQGQVHELGALMAAVTAAADGWCVTYLGADLPAAEIAAAVRDRRARVAALSLVYPEADPQTATELRELRRLLPRGVDLVIGGRAAGSYAADATELGIRVLASGRDLSELLAGYRSPAG